MDFGTENAELFNIFTFLFLYSLPSCRLRMKNELVVSLRACLNFLSLFPVSFPVVIRHVARYAPHDNRKISPKTALKMRLSKI